MKASDVQRPRERDADMLGSLSLGSFLSTSSFHSWLLIMLSERSFRVTGMYFTINTQQPQRLTKVNGLVYPSFLRSSAPEQFLFTDFSCQLHIKAGEWYFSCPSALFWTFAHSVPGLGRFPGGGHGNLLQYSCLENPMDRGVWRATVHRGTKSWTRLKQLSTHILV